MEEYDCWWYQLEVSTGCLGGFTGEPSYRAFNKSSAKLDLGSCQCTLLPLTSGVTRMQQSNESTCQNLCGGWDGSVPVVISNAEVGKLLQGVPALLCLLQEDSEGYALLCSACFRLLGVLVGVEAEETEEV